MAKRIIWAKEAVADRIQILDYWYKQLDSKEYSHKLDMMFKEVVQLLSNFPYLGRKLDSEPFSAVRLPWRTTNLMNRPGKRRTRNIWTQLRLITTGPATIFRESFWL